MQIAPVQMLERRGCYIRKRVYSFVKLTRPREHEPLAGARIDELPAWRGERAAQHRIGGDLRVLNSPRAYARILPLANA